MNVFHNFTRKSLAQNPARTVVTLVGIILSMALFTAVIEGAYSGVKFLQNCEAEKAGAWHGYYSELTQEAAKALMEQPEIDKSAELQLVGWAEIDSANKYNKPYLLVKSAGDGIEAPLHIEMVSGRMPENSNELILPVNLATSGNGNVIYDLGDTLTLQIGKRVSGGKVIPESIARSPEVPEEIIDTQERSYTVVGTYEQLDEAVEQYGCPGFTAFTRDTPGYSSTVFFTLKNPRRYYSFTASSGAPGNETPHFALLQLYGSVRNTNIISLIYGFAGVLYFLIVFGSISLIYNSFSISVSERTRQFGILKSVGATKKQIRSCVLYEALLLDAIAVPIGLAIGCAGIGIALRLVPDTFSMLISGVSVQMKLAAAPMALAIAAVVCVLTTLASALIPAKRAMRVSAIDAIRQTADVKIKGNAVKTSRITEKLFGFEGMMASKNFKRSKKRYRATIISLFLSITLFISASSFCAYLKNTVGGVVSSGSTTDIYYAMSASTDSSSAESIHKLLHSASGITGSFAANVTKNFFYMDADLADSSFFSVYTDVDAQQASLVRQDCMVYFIKDEDFKALCQSNGIDAALYFDQSAPKALLYNHAVTAIPSENGARKWYSYSLVDESKLPCTLYTQEIQTLDGFVNIGVQEINGERKCVYYSTAYWDSYWEDHDDESALDISEALLLSEEKVTQKHYFHVNAVVEQLPFAIETNEFALIYPMCVQASVHPAYENISAVLSYQSSNHAQTYSEMKKLLYDNHLDTSLLIDTAEEEEGRRMLILAINVFSYGFIILISMIAIANVFNTIATNISLRRREFAMLKSVGMSKKGFRRMMNYECLIYGMKSLLWGLPASAIVTWLLYRIAGSAFEMGFYIPWYSIAIAVCSVFVVVFATMLYATGKIRTDNPIEALKSENI